ncbi:MAG: hypothetical protein ACREEO_14385 [Phenylobacterium sp.]
MAELWVPFFAETEGWTVTIDGRTYRPALVDARGRLVVALDQSDADVRLANENYATPQTNNELIAAPGAALRIYVTGIFFSTEVVGSLKLTQSSGSPADVWGPHYFSANGGISAPTLSVPIVLNLNSALRATTDITGDHTVTVLAKVI